MVDSERLRLLWVTNLPAPYRFPAWNDLAAIHHVEVWCLGDTEANRDWSMPAPGSQSFSIRKVPARVISRGEVSLYLPPLRFPDVSTYDVVIIGGWESPYYWRLRRAARRRGIPSVLFYESTLASRRHGSGPISVLRRRTFVAADAVVTVGSASTEAALAMGLPRSKIHESFNTVDVDKFERAVTARRSGSEANGQGHRFLYVGQLIPRKNVAALISGFASMRDPDDTLTVVGQGPLQAELVAQAAGLGLGEAVVFTGALDEDGVIDAYASSDTLVLPSTVEVWGLVVNEALASGLHAVVSSSCGIARDVKGMAGVIVVEPTSGALASGMRASRASWVGPIVQPEMARRGPVGLADAVTSAITAIRSG